MRKNPTVDMYFSQYRDMHIYSEGSGVHCKISNRQDSNSFSIKNSQLFFSLAFSWGGGGGGGAAGSYPWGGGGGQGLITGYIFLLFTSRWAYN